MPFPLILIGIGVVGGTIGVVKGVRGVKKINEAKRIGKAAQERHKQAISRVNARRDQMSRRAKTYGRYLLRSCFKNASFNRAC